MVLPGSPAARRRGRKRGRKKAFISQESRVLKQRAQKLTKEARVLKQRAQKLTLRSRKAGIAGTQEARVLKQRAQKLTRKSQLKTKQARTARQRAKGAERVAAQEARVMGAKTRLKGKEARNMKQRLQRGGLRVRKDTSQIAGVAIGVAGVGFMGKQQCDLIAFQKGYDSCKDMFTERWGIDDDQIGIIKPVSQVKGKDKSKRGKPKTPGRTVPGYMSPKTKRRT